MKFVLSIFFSLALAGQVSASPTLEASLANPLPEYSKGFDEQRDPFKDAVHAINLAQEKNEELIVDDYIPINVTP